MKSSILFFLLLVGLIGCSRKELPVSPTKGLPQDIQKIPCDNKQVLPETIDLQKINQGCKVE